MKMRPVLQNQRNPQTSIFPENHFFRLPHKNLVCHSLHPAISIFPTIALVETTEEKQMRNEIAGKRLIRVPEVLRRVGFSRTTMYELIKEGRFPDKVIIGARSVAFVECEIDLWIENTISDSRRNNK